MKIFVNNIRTYSYHGVIPQERIVGEWYSTSIEVNTEDLRSTSSDNISDTINYADIAKVVSEEMTIPSLLLEHLAGRIGKRLLQQHPSIINITIRITKLNPPINGIQCDGAGIELCLNN